MGKKSLLKDFYMEPGYVFVPAEPTRISLVVTSGVAVTIYDPERKFGGISYYVRPYRVKGLSTAVFAAPALHTLIKIFKKNGCAPQDLEANVYGAAENSKAEGYEEGLAAENIKAGLAVLEKLKIKPGTVDSGGTRGRKIVFNSGTGEIIVAKVDKVRESDWYPNLN